MDTRLIVADILEGNLGDAKRITESILYQKSGEILEGYTLSVIEGVYGISEAPKKAKVTDKDDDGEGMDPVGAEDDDVDNDGDSDDSDEYLKNRRKTVKKAIAKDNGDEEEATEGYGKKMKKEDVEQVDEALPALALGAAKMMLGTKAGLATTGYMLGKSVQKKSMQDRQREVSGGVSDSVEHDDDSVEEDMTIFGMDRDKYAKLSDQEKRTIRTSYRAKREVSK